MNDFSYKHYTEMLKKLKATKKLTTFHDVDGYERDEYIVIRHDIELSPMRAAKMAKIEAEIGIQSTYLVQVDSNAYNPFSQENLKYLNNILYYKHPLGLHYNHDRKMKGSELVRDIENKLELLARGVNWPTNIFSGHMPSKQFLLANIKIPNVINCYNEKFFRHYSKPDNGVIYVTDANNQWRYGYPLEMLEKYDKLRMQIVIHPYTWNKENVDDQNNFLNLLGEKIPEFNNEMRKYRNYK